MKKIYVILCYCISSILLAQSFKLRIREQYEVNTIKFNGMNYKYNGFSNTLNFWYEDPYNISVGLSYINGSLLRTTSPSPLFPSKSITE